MDRGPTTLLITHPQLEPIVDAVRPDKLVYYAGDAFSHQAQLPPEVILAEKRLCDRADLVIAGSEGVGDLLPLGPTTRFHVSTAGVDADMFTSGMREQEPEDIRQIPHPRIGYHGNLNAKLDFNVVAEVALQRPEWHWILIGPTRESVMRETAPSTFALYQQCRKLPNVHFLGPRDYDSLPAYAGHVDAHALIYDLGAGEWVKTAYPLKLHECLASGKPVVSAPLPLIRRHADVVRFAATPQEWIQELEGAVANDDTNGRNARIRVASLNTWEARAKIIDEWLISLVAS